MHRNFKIYSLVPYYTKLNNSKDQENLWQTVRLLKNHTDEVVIIADGVKVLEREACTIIKQSHKGKAEAIRNGLHHISDNSLGKEYIVVQCDADLDQDPNDAELFIKFFLEMENSGKDSVIVVGDRYMQDQDSIMHRKGMLLLQESVMTSLGLQVRDPVSGFRAYNSDYVEKFLKMSKSKEYGVEVEQLVIASLVDALVSVIGLNYSRPRDSYTLGSKFINTFDAILLHKKSLKAKGRESVITFIETLRMNMVEEIPEFKLDLSSIGQTIFLKFNLMPNGGYSLEAL